ncbi:MAG TPA: LPS export ABC transporter periplasmic protein LptC [Candidatus Limnocylindrales bacterium]|nr:LPS export ABC transporter periplasmic protein LptC [Candidatus Limnocylindrales bacterium]
MRNKEAERYARWAVTAAGAIALIVAGVYGERAIRRSHANHVAPPVVPKTVQQQSAEFKFSKVEQDRTLFTVRASQATQYKDENRTLLQDVLITIYGREGNRNDTIHTRECSYEPKTGAVRCEGEVKIDIQGTDPASGNMSDKSLEIVTKNLSFDRETGEATTPAPVQFIFPEGTGHGVGIVYNSNDAAVRLMKAVEIDLAASEKTSGLPIVATGSSMEIRRNERQVTLEGPAKVRQGGRELSAEKIRMELDTEFRVQHAVAEGHPAIRSNEGGGEATTSADQMEAFLSPAGWVQRVVAQGNVAGTRSSPAGSAHFTAAKAEFTMEPQKNLLKDLTARGGVALDSKQGNESRSLKTDALMVTFARGERADQQRVAGFETLAPATIETKTGEEATELRAKKFVAQFNAAGKLEKLLGHTGVQVRRQFGKGAPQVSTAAELAAAFGASGEWATLDEEGNVHFQQADRQATAAQAHIVRETDMIALDGSPVLTDSQSRTTGRSVTINQKTGELAATGGVASTYLAAGRDSVDLGSGPAHISADSLSGSTTSGHVIYRGHARLWQGESVIDAEQIEVWRDEKKMQATGHVVAVFPQEASQGPEPTTKTVSQMDGPTLWHITAPALTYWNDQGKAHLEGGVTASSQQGQLVSRTLDVFIQNAPSQPDTGAHPSGRGQLTRALAKGAVVVRQGDRRGLAEQADYTAAEGKFVLSGGQPTLTDATGDTTTGRSLTFFVASDTILVDSQEGSRTLTKHRVEK